jgi:glycosyltransferase involved in cell wall biosynthesis
MVKKKYKFHILGLVHLPTSEKYMACAFTQKNVKMAKMLLSMGHEVWLYGAEGSDAPCTKFVETHKLKDIRVAWGDGDNRFDIGYNWHKNQFRHDINTEKKPVTLQYYRHAIETINKFKKPDDFLMITQGTYQKPIHDGTKLYLTIESGIGYRGSYCNFRSFESSYIQNFTYGSEHPRQSINGAFYDRVMPNYFDTNDFPYKKKKKDYFLFMGRMIKRKGVEIALKATDAIGAKLILAGQLSDEISLKEIEKYKNAEFVGFADAKKRAELMSNAKGVFTPSTYLEPFCGVHAESMLCGTPVITTNFGVFPETVINGVNGFRCDTLQDFVNAAKNIDKIDPKKVRETAEQFTMDSVSNLYQKWFDDLYQVYLSATIPNTKGWHYIEG